MNIRKTQRKNKTKQVIVWPSHDAYFTIDTLIESNNHMLTTSGSDITLRVRLNKAVSPDDGSTPIVAVIGQKNSGKGRPQLVFAMRPVKQSAIEKANADGISVSMTKVMPVMEITTATLNQPTTTPVTNITTPTSAPVVNA